MTKTALTIAGSDSGGGAGIQADIKAFSALGVYGCSVITALTAQNTRAVTGILDIDPSFIEAQIDAVFDDIKIDAVKIGMLSRPAVIETVARAIRRWNPAHVIVDPVMVAKSGDKLLADDAVEALINQLLPLASLITPNLPEACALLGERTPIERREQMAPIAARLQGLGPSNVLLKGGHLDGDQSPDLLLHGGEHHWLESPRVATRNTHGTGCSLSSSITALCAHGMPLPQAVAEAKAYITEAIAAADTLNIGQGYGPVHHFHALW